MIGRYRSMSVLVLLAVSVCIFELPIPDMLLCRPGVSEVVFICRGLSCYVGDGSLPYSLTLCAKKNLDTNYASVPPWRLRRRLFLQVACPSCRRRAPMRRAHRGGFCQWVSPSESPFLSACQSLLPVVLLCRPAVHPSVCCCGRRPCNARVRVRTYDARAACVEHSVPGVRHVDGNNGDLCQRPHQKRRLPVEERVNMYTGLCVAPS